VDKGGVADRSADEIKRENLLEIRGYMTVGLELEWM
jgi:hypothetical protein